MVAVAVACKKFRLNMNIWLGIQGWRVGCLTWNRANVQIIGAEKLWFRSALRLMQPT
jgi:hypothetical protein